jgi:hypothetical protein
MKFAISSWLIALMAWLLVAAPCSLGAELPRMVLIAEFSSASASQNVGDRAVAVLGEHEIAAIVVRGQVPGLGMQIGVWSPPAAKARSVMEEAIRTEGLPAKLLPEADKSEVPSVRSRRWSVRKPAPPVAQQAADAYFASLPDPVPEAKRRSYRDFYLGAFFRGFVAPRSWISQGSEQSRHAHEAGKASWRSHSGDLGKIMTGFGYTPVEVEGRWWRGFERSEFRPQENPAEEKWWLSLLENVVSDTPTTMARYPSEGVAVRITGYLSPPGGYGHLGMGDHEFFATKINRLPDSR